MASSNQGTGSSAPDVPTLGSLAGHKLSALLDGLQLHELSAKADDALERLAGDWRSWPIGPAPRWPSDITDDGTPFELSVAFESAATEVRILTEPQTTPIHPLSSWIAGMQVHERLHGLPGVSLESFDMVRELFEPSAGIPVRFSIWHSACLHAARPTTFKVYLNPQARGPQSGLAVVDDAFARLGVDDARAFVSRHIAKVASPEDLVYFSLDLSDHAEARAKIYLAHARDAADHVEQLFCACENHKPGDVQRWLESIAGDSSALAQRPILSCFAFTTRAAAPSGTLHIPIRGYVANDAEAFGRLLGTLEPEQLASLARGISSMTQRPLEMGTGLITYASLRRTKTGPRMTTYLAPEAYAVRTSLRPSTAAALRPQAGPPHELPSIESIRVLLTSHIDTLRQHPFLVHLESHASFEQIRAMADHMAFYVHAFQDMLRLARAHTTDPQLREIARTHELEDGGHDAWFMNDLERFGVHCDITSAFSEGRAAIRDSSYLIVSEILRAQSDYTRLAIVLCLEAVGTEFFGRVIARLEALRRNEGLRYFARSHQAVEEAHSVFSHAESESQPDAPWLFEVIGAVDRTFLAMNGISTHLEQVMKAEGAAS